jgi:hypothetical protein
MGVAVSWSAFVPQRLFDTQDCATSFRLIQEAETALSGRGSLGYDERETGEIGRYRDENQEIRDDDL